MKKILLVEDEAQVVSFINKGLSEENFQVSVAFNGRTGVEMAKTMDFDLIVLDVMLPDINGLEVCKEIRSFDDNVPILFLTALGTPENVVMGLDQGADDYLVKPFKFIELLARIKSLLRRAVRNGSSDLNQEEYLYRVADIVLNDYTKTLGNTSGKSVSLTSTEYRLLLYFVKNKSKVLSRADILDNIWGVNFDMGTNVVDVYVNYLRKKLDKVSQHKLVHTVIGMGYVLKEPQ